MGEQEFQKDVLQRLVRIETSQTNTNNECTPCRGKVDYLEIAVARIDAATKSARHRLDTMQTNSTELKNELKEAIKEQIAGIYCTTMIVGGITSFFVGIIMGLVTWVLNSHVGVPIVHAG